MRPLTARSLAILEEWYDVELTYTSNAIEGNTLSRSETASTVAVHSTIRNLPEGNSWHSSSRIKRARSSPGRMMEWYVTQPMGDSISIVKRSSGHSSLFKGTGSRVETLNRR